MKEGEKTEIDAEDQEEESFKRKKKKRRKKKKKKKIGKSGYDAMRRNDVKKIGKRKEKGVCEDEKRGRKKKGE